MSFVYKQAETKLCICIWLYIPRNSERIYKHDNNNYLDRQKKQDRKEYLKILRKRLLNDSYKKIYCFSYDNWKAGNLESLERILTP